MLVGVRVRVCVGGGGGAWLGNAGAATGLPIVLHSGVGVGDYGREDHLPGTYGVPDPHVGAVKSSPITWGRILLQLVERRRVGPPPPPRLPSPMPCTKTSTGRSVEGIGGGCGTPPPRAWGALGKARQGTPAHT